MASYLVLGRGYTGRVLERLLVSEGHRVTCTARSHPDLLRFVLEDETTWTGLPQKISGTFITFPFINWVSSRRFVNRLLPALGKTVFMGTTSAFLVTEEHQVIRENSEINPDDERNRAEAELLAAGCVGVHSAGIYGPDRSPLDWIQRGRVTVNDRYVNFIHVEDLAQVLFRSMCIGDPGTRYIACDGNPMRWSDIIHQLEDIYGVKSQPEKPGRRPSKRIDPKYTLDALSAELQYPDVIQGIRADYGESV